MRSIRLTVIEKDVISDFLLITNFEHGFRNRWSQLFPQFGSLEELANHIFSLKQENDKKKKSNERLEKQVPELEQQLQETQQKLLLLKL